MILKDLDPFTGSDKFLVAGRRAEEQMAHYLRRYFGTSPEVDVLNYVRITLGEEVAQIDHLILHPFGLTLVESKSVADSVQIEEDGQWIRWFEGRPRGMRSPVIQARMQSMLLRELLATTVKQKGFFDTIELDVMVAISDSGAIKWPATGALPEVCKADQVAEKIQRKVSVAQAAGAGDVLGAQHRRVIAQFLQQIHQPIGTVSPEKPTAAAPVPKEQQSSAPRSSDSHFGRGVPLPERICKHCGGAHLNAQHGKFGYYFVCGSCGKNTAVKFSCPRCAGEGRIRKEGMKFFAECRACDASELYHTNS